MSTQIIRFQEVTSTNDLMMSHPLPANGDIVVATAASQTKGRGQGANRWESQHGKNLLMSILTSPVQVAASEQYVLSMAGALALKRALDSLCADCGNADKALFSLKWPNDIYWNDLKISGTLIETSVCGKTLQRCVFGIGLNVNQRTFTGGAPNPVSLCTILGRDIDTDSVMHRVLKEFTQLYHSVIGGERTAIVNAYNEALYRRRGVHAYRLNATGDTFNAAIVGVGLDGLLRLRKDSGEQEAFALKEISFLPPQ